MKLPILLATTLLLPIIRLANADICTRCKCPADQQLTQIIDCSLLKLENIPANDEWPSSWTNDTANAVLTILDFDLNDIAKVDKFPKLNSVVGLGFRHNKIKELAEAAFANLVDLKKLDLSHNELSSDVIRADVFRGNFDNARYEPLNIVTLDLGYNVIHSLSAKAFEHLTELTELHLNNNPLKYIDSPTGVALGSSRKLEILNLGYTELTTISDDVMHTLKGLRELYLQGNHFEKVPETIAAVGGSLERLNLNDNPMTSLDANSFLGLGRLKELNVSGCQNLTEVGPATFSQLLSLRMLYLNFNFQLTYFDPDAFRELKDNWPIKQVHMKHNALTGLSRKLLPWNELDVLDLQENPWRCDCQLDWMIKELLPVMTKNYPEYTVELRCDAPDSLSGIQLLLANSTASTCIVPRPTLSIHAMAYPLHMFVVSIVILTIIVLAIALTILLRNECVKKRHRLTAMRDVSYSKQEDEEVFSI